MHRFIHCCICVCKIVCRNIVDWVCVLIEDYVSVCTLLIYKLQAGASDKGVRSRVTRPILIRRQPAQRCYSVHPLLPCSSHSWIVQKTLSPLVLSLTC